MLSEAVLRAMLKSSLYWATSSHSSLGHSISSSKGKRKVLLVFGTWSKKKQWCVRIGGSGRMQSGIEFMCLAGHLILPLLLCREGGLIHPPGLLFLLPRLASGGTWSHCVSFFCQKETLGGEGAELANFRHPFLKLNLTSQPIYLQRMSLGMGVDT